MRYASFALPGIKKSAYVTALRGEIAAFALVGRGRPFLFHLPHTVRGFNSRE